jgi:hypothetical protein
MFQFPRCPPSGLCVQPPVTDLSSAGLLHSGTLGSLRGYRSPRRFAASPRPSSAPTAQASTARPYSRTYHHRASFSTTHGMSQSPIAAFLACDGAYFVLLLQHLLVSSVFNVLRKIATTLAQVERGIGCERRRPGGSSMDLPNVRPFADPGELSISRALPSRQNTGANDHMA